MWVRPYSYGNEAAVGHDELHHDSTTGTVGVALQWSTAQRHCYRSLKQLRLRKAFSEALHRKNVHGQVLRNTFLECRYYSERKMHDYALPRNVSGQYCTAIYAKHYSKMCSNALWFSEKFLELCLEKVLKTMNGRGELCVQPRQPYWESNNVMLESWRAM